MIEPESRFYESSRLRLHYAVWGDEMSPPLILVHGSRDHARSWDFVAQALLDRYAVYALDLRGHGDSQWTIGGQYSVIDYVLDLAKLVEVIGRPRVTLIGHSLGGGVVLEYAGTFPDRVEKVISIEGLGPRGQMFHRPADRRMREYVRYMWELEERQPRRYGSLEEAATRMREANRRLSPDMAAHLTKHGVHRHEDGSYSWKFDNFTRIRSPYEWNAEDARTIWNAIRAPVLLVRGSDSWHQDPSRDNRASAFHDMRSVMVEDAGHWVHHDQLDRFLAVVDEFLRA
jgi:pimeloyl-ACP methyl ester carboxylesterase